MQYKLYTSLNNWEKEHKKQIDIVNKTMREQLEKQEPIKYTDTIFKDMANDIVSSQHKIEEQLNILTFDNVKSEKKTNRIAVITLIVSILTLITTIIGILVQVI